MQDGLDWRSITSTRDQAEVTRVAARYSDKGKLLGRSAKQLTALRTAANDALPTAETTFILPVSLPQGVARLRFIVRDAVNGHMGTTDVLKP